MKRTLPACCLLLLVMATAADAGDGRKVRVTLKLYSGGQLTGQVTEYDDHRLIVQAQGRLLAVAWNDVQTPSAYQAKKHILQAARGSLNNLTAEDHFQLGYFLALRNSHSAAVAEFRQAETRDPSYQERIRKAWRDIRRAKEKNIRRAREPIYSDQQTNRPPQPIGRTRQGMNYKTFTHDQHRQAIAEFKKFGEHIRSSLAPDLVLLETRNFLIFTDWPERQRNLISDWAEQMYNQMCEEFGFPREQPIWLGKCPIFCFKSESRFRKFAEQVDGYDNRSAVGYTKTTEQGYVHVVLRRLGNSAEAVNKFATTMVHEASHAFMHSYGSPINLPPWLSEGLADYIAERVLGDRCDTGEVADAMARQYAYARKTVRKLFEFEESPPGDYYPIAHSLVDYLITRDHDAFVGMVNDIKSGRDPQQAMAFHYKGLNTNTLEYAWRAWILKRFPQNP